MSPTSRVYTGSGICVKKRHINLLVCAALRYFAPSTAVLLPGFFALSKRRDIALRRSTLHFSPPSCNLLVHSSQNISIRIIYNTCSRQPRTTQRSKAPEQNNVRHPPYRKYLVYTWYVSSASRGYATAPVPAYTRPSLNFVRFSHREGRSYRGGRKTPSGPGLTRDQRERRKASANKQIPSTLPSRTKSARKAEVQIF